MPRGSGEVTPMVALANTTTTSGCSCWDQLRCPPAEWMLVLGSPHLLPPPCSRGTPLRNGVYLEGLQKASMTPIFQLVLLRPQPQHGLCVPVELIVEVVQQGCPCPVLWERGAQPAASREGTAVLTQGTTGSSPR